MGQAAEPSTRSGVALSPDSKLALLALVIAPIRDKEAKFGRR